ncbi:MAG: CpsB/CapC family capsule biosynthesis tyrosine phosphatase [Planctomycetota bacterium]
MPAPFVDIHCHLAPGIDDGARDHDETLAMAMIHVDEGFDTVVVTPHQLGSYAGNTGDAIRQAAEKLQETLTTAGIGLRVLPGADVRIDEGMIDKLVSGDVLTLGDHGRHVLLELPHEVYLPLESLLDQLRRRGIVGVLSHPERNHGILRQPSVVERLVDAGCLMQVTAGSLTGGFGPASRSLAEQMCRRGQVHFLATDAHGSRSRRPKMQQAYTRAVELAGVEAADLWCCEYPRRVATGKDVPAGATMVRPARSSGWAFWRKAA